MSFAPFYMPTKKALKPYLYKRSIVIKGIMHCKIVYFGDDGIAINRSPYKLFGITIGHGKESRYISLSRIHHIKITRTGIKNQLIINNTAIFTWCTIAKNSYSYEKMSKLVRIVERQIKVLQINS